MRWLMIYYYKDDWDKILTESIVSTLVQIDYLLKQADTLILRPVWITKVTFSSLLVQ